MARTAEEQRAYNAQKQRESRAKKKVSAEDAPPVEGDTPPPDGAFTIDVEDAPEDTFVEEKESLLGNIFSKLGIKNTPDEGVKQGKSPTKLTARQRQFCDTFTPLASWSFMLAAAWVWGRIGNDYRVLAPSEEVATNIVAPLIRIYARQAKFVNAINPNYIDGAASMTALIGYVYSSVELYRQIKSGALDAEGTNDEQEPANFASYQSRHGRADAGRDAVQRADGRDTQGVTDSQHIDTGTLTAHERYQFEKLSALRQRDIDVRTRRSGRVNSVLGEASG